MPPPVSEIIGVRNASAAEVAVQTIVSVWGSLSVIGRKDRYYFEIKPIRA